MQESKGGVHPKTQPFDVLQAVDMARCFTSKETVQRLGLPIQKLDNHIKVVYMVIVVYSVSLYVVLELYHWF